MAELQRTTAAADTTLSDGRLAATRDELRSLSARVPIGVDVGDLIKELSAALVEAGVDRREIVTQPTANGRPFSRTPVTLRLECSFEQAFRVLKRVESCSRLTRIDRLSVTSAGEDRSRPLRVEVEISAFSRGAEEAAAWGTLE
jgi:Tfp pilus assembly protein PilO